MSNIQEKIEDFLVELDLPYKNIEEHVWLVNDTDQRLENIVVQYHDKIISFRITICGIPQKDKEKFFEKLLKYNTNIIYGGYAIVEDKIIITHSISFENISFKKFSYEYSAFTYSLIEDLKKILNNKN